MKIHEYQAKAILARHGVPVPRGEITSTPAEAGEIAKRLGGAVVVVKAQIHVQADVARAAASSWRGTPRTQSSSPAT
jgi:Succinyl-CoA synthetase, beta subunit